MTKTHINIVIDLEVYLMLQESKINKSKLINEFLKDYFKVEKEEILGDSKEEKIQNIKLKKLKLDEEIKAIEREEEDKLQEIFKTNKTKYYDFKLRKLLTVKQWYEHHGELPRGVKK